MSSSTFRSPLFTNLCMVLQKISSIRGTQEKKRVVQHYLYQWRADYGDDFYEAMRLFLPHLDKNRRYNLKEAKLAKAYVDALGLGKKSDDAYNLTNWKLPSTSKYTKSSGDFAAVAYEIIKSRSTVMTPTQTVHDVNMMLDRLSHSESNEKKKEELFKEIVNNYTAFEQKWIIRIILKDLKIGMSENSIFDVYHHQARQLYDVCSNLQKVCEDLQNPLIAVGQTSIQLFQPFKPQLSLREVPKNVRKFSSDGRFYIEQKIDGERMQMHFDRRSQRFRWWTRKATDYTEMYGDSPIPDKLAGAIFKNLRADSMILDGEMVAYDPNLDVYLPFGTLKSSAKDLDTNPLKARPCFIVFDIVYCNNTPMVNYPLVDRLKTLNAVVKENRGHLNLLPRLEKSTLQDIVDALEKAIQNREEGIVVKNPSSIYEPGARNPNWIKLKPEYIDSIHDNCDLLVVGAKYGTGRRGNRLAQFLCAIRDDRVPEAEGPKFITFAMLGSGYTMEELEEFSKLLPIAQPYNSKKQPPWLIHPPKSSEVPDVIIDYADSIVVEVKATEITWTNQFGAGSTLRFPRFVRFRKDKGWQDIMTQKEMINARREGKVNASQKRESTSQADFLGHSPSKRAKKPAAFRPSLPYKILETQQGINTAGLKKKSLLFEDMIFYVINGEAGYSKADLEKLIIENGGDFKQNSDGAYVIAGKKNVRVDSMIHFKKHDIIKPQWILDCVDQHDLVPLTPRYMFFITEKTQHDFLNRMDEYGDPYTVEATEKSLREVLPNVPVEPISMKNARALVGEIHRRYFQDGIPGMLFQTVVAYVDLPSIDLNKPDIENMTMQWVHDQRIRDKLKLVSQRIAFGGGQIVDKPKEGVTHIIMDAEDVSRLMQLTKAFRGQLQPRFVTTEWVDQCVRNETMLDEARFEPIFTKRQTAEKPLFH
ncbi:uncharacterized protein BYT42DRAFT_569559 [Radiomyces spectabilis]|uniref:uncharacterized protein n=1 Tax=Radiomyces spectabilis TaxID=64574 RepID=UPI00221F53DB|nr:uncharacterized protein BYT42DRAFT_569559 [Radiomyces spectabilis]KAI8379658.1 hypothetical protein BYT42DRAFT_569559 [Radiomyces spectabilis]